MYVESIEDIYTRELYPCAVGESVEASLDALVEIPLDLPLGLPLDDQLDAAELSDLLVGDAATGAASFMPFRLASGDGLTVPPANGGLTSSSARGLLVVVAALYGTNFGCTKLMEELLTPSAALAARFAVATLFLAPACMEVSRTSRSLCRVTRDL